MSPGPLPTLPSINITDELLQYFSGPSKVEEKFETVENKNDITQYKYEIVDIDSNDTTSEAIETYSVSIEPSVMTIIQTNNKQKNEIKNFRSDKKNNVSAAEIESSLEYLQSVSTTEKVLLLDYYRLLRTGNSPEEESRYHNSRYWGMKGSIVTPSTPKFNHNSTRESHVKMHGTNETELSRKKRDVDTEPIMRRDHRRNTKRKRSGHRKKKGSIGR